MALTTRSTTAPPTIHGAPCSVGQYYRDQADNDAEIVALNEHLYGLGLDAGELMQIFIAESVPIRRTSINKHRSRTCRCFTIDKDVCCHECKYDRAHCVCADAA